MIKLIYELLNLGLDKMPCNTIDISLTDENEITIFENDKIYILKIEEA